MGSLGDAFVDVHGNTAPFDREVERGVKLASEEAEDEAVKGGKDLGDAMGKALGDNLKNQGPKLAREIEAGLKRQKIRTKVTAQLDKEGNVVRQWVTTITDEIQDAFDVVDAKGRQGIFGRISTGISDAIGAGFNISGRSPLIALLVPLLATIVGLILAAVQAAGSLVAILFTLPAVIGAVALQAGIVAIAFDGMGTAIEGAFAAKNAQELNEALKELTPSAQQFVRDLLPLRDVFKEIRGFLQENFFQGLGSLFGENGVLLPLLGAIAGAGPLARQLGVFFHELAAFFGSPAFVTFVEEVMPATVEFLSTFGPSFVAFLTGFTEFATATLPFLGRIGDDLSETFTLLGQFLSDAARDPGLQEWFDRMFITWRKVQVLITEAFKFIAAFMSSLDKAGGNELLDALSEALDRLTFFISSPAGIKALEGLIHAAEVGIIVFTGLAMAILLVFAIMEKLAEIVNMVIRIVSEGLSGLWGDISGFFSNLGGAFLGFFNTETLFQAGRNLIIGLMSGIRSMFNPLRAVMGGIGAIVAAFLPFSPAREGPLSGEGDPLLRGREISARLAEGITTGGSELRTAMTSATSNIVFGPGSVQLGFHGALPTEEEAMTTGMAAGAGITAVLARQASLAVRMA